MAYEGYGSHYIFISLRLSFRFFLEIISFNLINFRTIKNLIKLIKMRVN